MGLYRRPKSPYWWIKYHAAGERIQESTRTASKAEAQQFLNLRKQELENGIWRHPRNRKETFGEIVDLYTDSLAFETLADKTRTFYAQRLEILIGQFQSRQVMSLTRKDVEAFIRERSGAVSTTTIHHELTTLFTVLRWAVREGHLQHLPFLLDRLKPAREDFRSRVLVPTEEKAILEKASEYQRAMIISALDAGMHKKEIFAQQWIDIDFERNLIVTTESKKGRAGRIAPLTMRFRDVLQSLHKTRESDYVFTYHNKPITTDIKKGWYRILEDAEVQPIRFHDLRATYRTRLEELSIPPAVSMALMGHKRKSVNDRYTRPQLPALRDAIAKLDLWLVDQGLYVDPTRTGKVLRLKRKQGNSGR